MNHNSATSVSSPTSSPVFSSPALPELSLDASLQLLHEEEDSSESPISSTACRSAWFSTTQEQGTVQPCFSLDDRSAYHQATEAAEPGRSTAFRFPPSDLAEFESKVDPEDQVSATRPRTSRGLSEPKPFLSSSRDTSIASIAEVKPGNRRPDTPRIAFGTPFTGNVFGRGIDDFEFGLSDSEQQPDSLCSDGSGRPDRPVSPKQTCKAASSIHRVETCCSPAHAEEATMSASASWTILFTPIEQTNSPHGTHPSQAQPTILLPLLPSIQEQIEHLKSHLTKPSTPSDIPSVLDSDVRCFLDLSSVSGLPGSTLARLTDPSWSIAFRRYFEQDADDQQYDSGRKDSIPLPQLYRETGLPIVALVRYSLVRRSTQACKNLDAIHRAVENALSTHDSEHKTTDSNPWIRRESELTISPTYASRTEAASSMVTSKSYPGTSRTWLRRSPLPFSSSPQTTSFPRGTPRSLTRSANTTLASPAVHSANDERPIQRSADSSKLRPLSLVPAHPRAVSSGDSSQPATTERHQSPKSLWSTSSGAVGIAGQAHRATVGGDSVSSSAPLHRSSRGSSHKSYPSNATSNSTHSTQPTSLYSSRSHIRPSSEHDGSDADTEEDEDIGRRFWSQLSRLGEQVSRAAEAKAGSRSKSRPVSISSTASSASVFDFSPLGILVPTEGQGVEDDHNAGSCNGAEGDSAPRLSLDSLLPPAAQPSLLGRRRAHSSMIPLTGWRAGDSFLSTAEGQRELPQVLVLDHRERSFIQESMDLVTPTAATFQGRARSLSFQPPSSSSKSSGRVSEQLTPCGKRQEIWEEAMHQLTERISRSWRQPASELSPTAQAKNSSTEKLVLGADASTRSDNMRISPSSGSAERATLSADAWFPPIESSPLPGLFYDTWVERVDGAIDGDLGRRGSAFRSLDHDTQQSGLQPDTYRPSPPDSAPIMLRPEFAWSESLLQVMHESEWPLPMERSASDSLLPASASFLSVNSSRVGEKSVEKDEDEVEALESGIVAGEDERPEIPPSARPTRVAVPQVSEASGEADIVRSASRAFPEAGDPASGWTELAHRLESPGSMRLLCLAAASWSPAQPDAARGLTQVGSAKDGGASPSGLRMPTHSTDNEETPISADDQAEHLKPKPVTRVKRSLSNIFDPTPSRTSTCLD